MKYETKTKKQAPSVINWIKTIKGLQILCKRLLKDGFKFILLRNFNQDLIENFFGSIRSHGVRNIKPSCENFISSFKSLVINNLTSSNSIGSNCENDDCDGALDNLKEFLSNDNLTGIHPLDQGWATGGPRAFFIWPALHFSKCIRYIVYSKFDRGTAATGFRRRRADLLLIG